MTLSDYFHVAIFCFQIWCLDYHYRNRKQLTLNKNKPLLRYKLRFIFNYLVVGVLLTAGAVGLGALHKPVHTLLLLIVTYAALEGSAKYAWKLSFLPRKERLKKYAILYCELLIPLDIIGYIIYR